MDTPTPRPWIHRHWKWLIPAGCLGLMATVASFASLIFFIGMGSMKSSGIYQDAVAALKASPEAVAAVGEPISTGLWVIGTIHVSGPAGEADLAFPVSGPSASGRLYVIGTQQAGEWSMERLELAVEGREERIDLLPVSPLNRQPADR